MRFLLLLLITPAASVGTYYLPPGLSQMEADYFLNALIEDDYLHQQPSVNFMQPPNMNEGGGGGGTANNSSSSTSASTKRKVATTSTSTAFDLAELRLRGGPHLTVPE